MTHDPAEMKQPNKTGRSKEFTLAVLVECLGRNTLTVTGRLKTGHLWALQNQPP
jgi:hypothetical protein